MLAAALGAAGPILRLHRVEGTRWLQAALLLAVAAALLEFGLWRSTRRPFAALPVAATLIGAVIAVLTWPWVGRAPGPLVIAGVVLAHLALVGRPRRTGVPAPPAALAVPFVVAAQLTWLRTGSNRGVLAILAVAAVVVAGHGRFPQAMGRVSAGLERMIAGLASFVAAAGLLVVAVPTLYAAGAASRLLARVTRPLRRRTPSAWITRTIPESDVRQDAARPFVSTERPVRRRRSLGGMAAIAAVIVTAWVLVDVRSGNGTGGDAAVPDPGRPDNVLDQIDRLPYSSRPAFAGAPWADELQAEQLAIDLVPDAVTVYRAADHRGDYVNVVDGERTTVDATCSCPVTVLWLFGGSAAFGIGQRDDHTVASQLVRLAAADGVALSVANLGVPGWTVWQEAGAFEQRVEQHPPPDLAVFLDGFNDTLGTITQSAASGRVGAGPTLLDNDEVLAFTDRHLSAAERGGGRSLGVEAARRYRRQMDRIAAVARPAGVATAYFFQPDPFAAPSQLDTIEGIYRYDPDLFERAEVAAALDAAAAELSPDVTDLRALFVDETEPVFGDVVHTNEQGAEAVAGAIYAAIRAEILAAAAD